MQLSCHFKEHLRLIHRRTSCLPQPFLSSPAVSNRMGDLSWAIRTTRTGCHWNWYTIYIDILQLPLPCSWLQHFEGLLSGQYHLFFWRAWRRQKGNVVSISDHGRTDRPTLQLQRPIVWTPNTSTMRQLYDVMQQRWLQSPNLWLNMWRQVSKHVLRICRCILDCHLNPNKDLAIMSVSNISLLRSFREMRGTVG